MNINATLFGQMITFVLFIGFTMKFVWPHITKALAERQEKIADGLAAAERSERELELAQHKSTEMMRDTKVKAAEIIEQANQRASQIVEDAKEKARAEGQRLLELAQAEIQQEVNHAKSKLRQQVASVAIIGAEKILGRNIDMAANNDILESLIEEI